MILVRRFLIQGIGATPSSLHHILLPSVPQGLYDSCGFLHFPTNIIIQLIVTLVYPEFSAVCLQKSLTQEYIDTPA